MDWGAVRDVGTSFWSLSNTFAKTPLVKTERLLADLTAVGSPDRSERAILEVILAGRVFGQSRSFLWSGSEPLCGVGTSS